MVMDAFRGIVTVFGMTVPPPGLLGTKIDLGFVRSKTGPTGLSALYFNAQRIELVPA